MKNKKIISLLSAAILAASACALGACGVDTQASEPTLGDGCDAAMTVNANTDDENTQISSDLFGIFLEDINYGVDGGLYAEQVRNRSFEYGALASDGAYNGWRTDTSATMEVVSDGNGICSNNPSYARVTSLGSLAGITNIGFLEEGMTIKQGAVYKFSVYIKNYGGNVRARIIDTESGDGYGELNFSVTASDTWKKYEGTITATATANENVGLNLSVDGGTADVDMISLIPEDTVLNMRSDMIQALKDLNPKFLRFPGGCVVEGASFETMYDWKDSIGVNKTTDEVTQLTVPVVDVSTGAEEVTTTYGGVETRPLGINIWDPASNSGPAYALKNGLTSDNPYYMTYGIGFYEYLLLCEEMGIKAVPDVSVGMTCFARSSTYECASKDELEYYVQSALDFVAFCNGATDSADPDIAYWAGMRAAMGHEEPFNIEYLEIGNEQYGDDFLKNYSYFQSAFSDARKNYPEVYGGVQIIISDGSDDLHTYAYEAIEDSGLGTEYAQISDEHYYNSYNWFYENCERYDSETYDKYLSEGITVFLGEYAAQENTLRSAIAEAAYMTMIERNGDVVQMASYAPLFARSNTDENQWKTDMIFVSGDSLYCSPDYYIQQLFMSNLGTTVLNSKLLVGERTYTTMNIFQVATKAENGDIVITLVNSYGYPMNIGITVEGDVSISSEADITVFNADGITDETTKNSLTKTALYNTYDTLEVDKYFEYDMPAYSATVIRIRVS